MRDGVASRPGSSGRQTLPSCNSVHTVTQVTSQCNLAKEKEERPNRAAWRRSQDTNKRRPRPATPAAASSWAATARRARCACAHATAIGGRPSPRLRRDCARRAVGDR